MQIRTLTIHNIASLSDAVIDFGSSPLNGAPIFLISGETGAGKSTILDAISLALYGNTPRMMSVTKEEIASYDQDERFKFYADDNSQLLRRGTGEGYVMLSFIGNDGKDYEISWAVQRDYKKAGYKLQRDARRTLVACDGSFSENNIKPIDNKVRELVGMDYSQFCRTVMLAQGEFTKFLKSSGKEKAEILEKLTGTEIYSRVGRKIAERYAEKKSLWESLDSQTRNIHLLTDAEIAEKRDFVEGEENRLNECRKVRDEASRKLNWLMQSGKLEDDKAALSEKYAIMKAKVEEESFSADKRLVSDYREAEHAGKLTEELAKIDAIIDKNNLLVPQFKAEFDLADKVVMESERLLHDQSLIVEKDTEKYDSFGVKKLNASLKVKNTRIALLSDVLAKGKEYALKREKLSDVDEQKREKEEVLAENVKGVDMLISPIAESRRNIDICVERLSKTELSLNDAVREMRHGLAEGDICPVCGQEVSAIVDDRFFDSVLEPLRAEKNEAEKLFNDLSARKIAGEKIVDEIRKEIDKLNRKHKRESATVKKIKQEYDSLLKSAGFSQDLSDGDINVMVESETESLRREIDTIHESLRQAEECMSVLKESRNKEKELQKNINVEKDKREQVRIALEKALSDLQNHENRRNNLRDELKLFYDTHPSISEGRVAVLMSVREEVVRNLESSIAMAEKELALAQGGLHELTRQIDDLVRIRPDFGDEDNVESLKELIAGKDAAIQAMDRAIGQIKEQLSKDDECRGQVMELVEKAEAARNDKDRWEGLYRLLGDTGGSRFRSVAQSFILKSLLDNANNYMRCFTDRYTLTCNPGSLVIMVEDCFKPGEPQPSSILSGGESFMASLSLALGLSHLRGGGMGVDVIFIDEGFGTLSNDCLSNVMNTLERLHQIGGRRVGLISHVAEMKERIPVQIQVKRESPALSRISVVNRAE